MSPLSPDASRPLPLMARNAPWKIDPQIRRQIRCTAAQMVGKAGLTKQDREDLEQELMIYLLSRLDCFDERRASPQTFVTRLLRAAACNIIAARWREKRDWRINIGALYEDMEDEEGACALATEVLSVIAHEADREARTAREKHNLRMDMERFLATLSQQERQACILTMKKHSQYAAQQMGLPRASLYDLMVKLRERFEAFGLKKYL